jgi:lipopolysaccharide export system permease protein
MIITRYICGQITKLTIVIACILLLISYIPVVITQLNNVMNNDMLGSALIGMLIFVIPESIELLLPLSLFAAILVGYVNMHSNNEIIALSAAKLSLSYHLRALSAITIPIFLILLLSVSAISPWCKQQITLLSIHTNVFTSLGAKKFNHISGGYTFYLESMNEDNTRANDVLLLKANQNVQQGSAQLIIKAQQASIIKHADNNMLLFTHGNLYQNTDGQYRVSNFERYAINLPGHNIDNSKGYNHKTAYLWELWQKADIDSKAELYWRLSLCILVPVIAMLALAFSHVKIRQQVKLSKFALAILCYSTYISLLIYTYDSMLKTQSESYAIWMLLTHIAFILLSVVMLSQQQLVWYMLKYKKLLCRF